MPELPTCSPFRARIHAAVCWVDSATLVNRNFEPGEEDLLRDRLEEEGLEYLNDAHERQLADASEHNPEKENTTAVSVIIDIVNIAWLRASLRVVDTFGGVFGPAYVMASAPLPAFQGTPPMLRPQRPCAHSRGPSDLVAAAGLRAS